jgi:hypothetical protein
MIDQRGVQCSLTRMILDDGVDGSRQQGLDKTLPACDRSELAAALTSVTFLPCHRTLCSITSFFSKIESNVVFSRPFSFLLSSSCIGEENMIMRLEWEEER